MWLDKQLKRVYFETKVVETQSVVISGAYVNLHDIKQSDVVSSASTPQPQQTTAKSESFASDKVFNELTNKLKEDPTQRLLSKSTLFICFILARVIQLNVIVSFFLLNKIK
jgi:hypothetical protein